MSASPAAMAEVVANFYQALSRKDLQGAIACCRPEAVFWHNFDGVELSLEQAAGSWQGLFAGFAENRIDSVEWDPIPSGLVQRHRFFLRGDDGALKAKFCCIFVRFQGGKISRLDEYIDLSRSLEVPVYERD
ncbi:nuclear transport factor 2 family protein [Haliea sp. E17]|uniref:nuclear transport factor 2 family protein n=1 Tax=Haliea sp. E17 TaxID=3401576 RepID=UPI003AAA4104